MQAQLKQALDAALAEAKKAARPGQVEVQTGNFSLFPRYAQQGRRSPAGRARPSSSSTAATWRRSAQLSGRITTMTVARVAYRLSREASQKVEGEVAAEAIARYRAKAGEYAKQFGYGGYSIREVNVDDDRAAAGADADVPDAGGGGARRPATRSRSSPARRRSTATVSGTVQMK